MVREPLRHDALRNGPLFSVGFCVSLSNIGSYGDRRMIVALGVEDWEVTGRALGSRRTARPHLLRRELPDNQTARLISIVYRKKYHSVSDSVRRSQEFLPPLESNETPRDRSSR